MTSTNIHIGLSENSRNSSKVLKPPGGGSSDIFGNGNGAHAPPTPRSNKGMISNIFAAPAEKTVNGDNNRRHANLDSHARLFGEADRPYTPAKNHQKSNIPLGNSDSVDATPKTNGTNGHSNGNSKVTNGEAMLINGNGHKHVFLRRRKMNSPLSNRSNSSSIEDIISPRSFRPSQATTPRRKIFTPPDNLPIRPIAINTHVDENGTAPLTNVTNSSTLSSLTDDSISGMTKSPKLEQRNPVTGTGIDAFRNRGVRRMDGRRDGNPVTGQGYTTEINTSVPALNGTKQVINKNRVPPGGYSSGLW